MYITLLCALFFSGTSFSLYPTAAVIFGLTLLSDKYLLLHFHPKNGQFDKVYHLVAFLQYVPSAIVLHAIASNWALRVFNREMNSVISEPIKEVYVTVHTSLLVLLFVWHFCKKCKDYSLVLKDEFDKLLSDETQPKHKPSDNFLAEVPIKNLLAYYLRTNEALSSAKEYHTLLKENAQNQAYIDYLEGCLSSLSAVVANLNLQLVYLL